MSVRGSGISYIDHWLHRTQAKKRSFDDEGVGMEASGSDSKRVRAAEPGNESEPDTRNVEEQTEENETRAT